MPYIPPFKPRLSTLPQSTPAARVANPMAGDVAAAVGQLGSTLSQVSGAIYEKRQRAANMAFVDERETKRLLEVDEFVSGARISFSGDHGGYAEAVGKFISEIEKQDLEEAPTETAKQLYKAKISGQHYQRVLRESEGYERIKRAEHYRKIVDDSVEDVGHYFAKAPREQWDALDRIRGLEGKVVEHLGINFSEEEAKERTDRIRALSETYFAGIEASDNKTLYQRALNELEAQKEGGVADYLDPPKRAALIDKFRGALKAKTVTDRAEISERARDSVASIIEGGGKILDRDLYTKEIPARVRSGTMGKDEAVRLYNDAHAASFYAETLEKLKSVPRSQLDKAIQNFDAEAKAWVKNEASKNPITASDATKQPTFGAAEAMKYRNALNAQKLEILKQQEEDPAGFVASRRDFRKSFEGATLSDPSRVRSYVSRSMAEQERLGLEQRVLTNSQAEGFAKTLQEQPNPQQANAVLSQMQLAYGSHFEKALAEMVEHGKLDGAWRVAATMDGRLEREAAIGTVANKKAIETAWKKERSEGETVTVRALVNKEIQDYRHAMNAVAPGGGNMAALNEVSGLIETRAKDLNLGADAVPLKDAVKKAAEMVRKERPIIWGAGAPIVFKVGKNSNPKLAEAFMDANLPRYSFIGGHGRKDQVEILRDLGVEDKMIPEKDRERFFGHIGDTGQWRVNKSLDGVELWFRNLETGEMERVFGKNKKPIGFTFQDITLGNIPEKAKERMYKKAEPFFSRNLESAPRDLKKEALEQPMKGPKF